MKLKNYNGYLKSLEGKLVIFRMQQVYSLGKNPYIDLINLVEEIEVKNIELTKESYLHINNTFINITPELYCTIEFNPSEMRFNCDGENISLTISFDTK